MQLVRGAGAKATAVARPACALLRQLAGSDTLKPHIISADGLVGSLPNLETRNQTCKPPPANTP